MNKFKEIMSNKAVIISLIIAVTVIVITFLITLVAITFLITNNNNKETKTISTTEVTQHLTEAPTEVPTEKETEPKTEAPTLKPTQAPTQKPTQKTTPKPTEAPKPKELTIADVTGLWSHTEYSDNYTITVNNQDGNKLDLTICAVRGNGAQIATCDVSVTVVVDAAGGVGVESDNLSGRGTFKYTDSFSNKGSGEILVDKNSIELYIYESYSSNLNWGIGAATGTYIR